MRQFVLGALALALVWFGYDSWFGGAHRPEPATVDPATVQAAPRTATSAGLDQLLAGAAPRAAIEPPRPAAASAAPPVALADLQGGIAARDPAAIATAWRVLASDQSGGDRQRLLAALAPAAGDFQAQLAALGNDNGFLHSVEGRARARDAMERAMALPDAEAVVAGSALLELMLRGRIERHDAAARAAVEAAYQQHRIRVDRWVCSPANVAGARSYTVVAGDSLDRIAARFRRERLVVESGTLALLNRIHNPNALQVGQKLKVPLDPLRAVVEKRSYSLAVYLGAQLLRLYWIGHGEHDRTPVAVFTVVEKEPRPNWTAPDGNVYPYGHPKNILGEYFIKFQHPEHAGFGAHGTPMPETIGTMSSMGCIRMLDADIAELFRILPRGAVVEIRANESLRP